MSRRPCRRLWGGRELLKRIAEAPAHAADNPELANYLAWCTAVAQGVDGLRVSNQLNVDGYSHELEQALGEIMTEATALSAPGRADYGTRLVATLTSDGRQTWQPDDDDKG